MAGTLTISTLSDGTNSTSSTNCIKGSAKAWVNFAGTSGAINGSYNVSSVTRTATGSYTVNMTNALADANYAIAGSGTWESTSTNSTCIVGPIYTGTYTTSAYQIISANPNSQARFDAVKILSIVIGN